MKYEKRKFFYLLDIVEKNVILRNQIDVREILYLIILYFKNYKKIFLSIFLKKLSFILDYLVIIRIY